jgi:hypothetical protein
MKDESLRELRFVSRTDPALDRKRMNLDRYTGTDAIKGSRDPSLVVTHPGQVPVWITARALGRTETNTVNRVGPTDARDMCIMFGLLSVELADGRTLRPDHEVERNGTTQSIWSDEGLDNLRQNVFPDAVLVEIMQVINDLGNSRGNAYRGSVADCFTLPRVLLLVLEQSALPPAE